MNQSSNRTAMGFQHILHHSTRFRRACRCSDCLICGSFTEKKEDKNNHRKFEGFPGRTGGANHHCYTRLVSQINKHNLKKQTKNHIMLPLPYNDCYVSGKHATASQLTAPSIMAIITFPPLISSSNSVYIKRFGNITSSKYLLVQSKQVPRVKTETKR